MVMAGKVGVFNHTCIYDGRIKCLTMSFSFDRIDFIEFVHALGEPEDSVENEDDDDLLFSPLPINKSVAVNDSFLQ